MTETASLIGVPARSNATLGSQEERIAGSLRERADLPWSRITFNPEVMGGKPCIRGMRVTAGMVLGLLASGCSHEEILKSYPYLEAEDIWAVLAYATWRCEEMEQDLVAS